MPLFQPDQPGSGNLGAAPSLLRLGLPLFQSLLDDLEVAVGDGIVHPVDLCGEHIKKTIRFLCPTSVGLRLGVNLYFALTWILDLMRAAVQAFV